MKLNKLNLINYRNYKTAEINFKNGLNIIIGKNAQGKTNLLESVYFCAIGRSLRAAKEKELINFNDNFNYSKIKCGLTKKFGDVEIEIVINKNAKKAVKINNTTILKIADLLGNLTAVYFSPDEMKLIKEGPDNRRRFLDVAISQLNKMYFYSLLRYEKILMHRNKLLKKCEKLEDIRDSLEIFTTQLINEASYIILMRKEFIRQLRPYFICAHENLTNSEEAPEIEYIPVAGENIEEIKKELIREFSKTLAKDFEQKCTNFGPHRDDFKIKLNSIDVRLYGSQGQQRSVTLSLKIAEMEISKAKTGEYPVLLLDDVLSELDLARQKKLLEYAKITQVILTCTHFDFDVKNVNLIKIENGKII